MAECARTLGDRAAREFIEAFTVFAQETSEYRPSGDEFIPWVADILFAMERKYEAQISGGIATLLWISSGARPLSSEDRFENSRKTWDEALRRARKRERFGGPEPSAWTARAVHRALIRLNMPSARTRRKPSLQEVLVKLEFELEQLGHAAERLSLREAIVLLQRVNRLRMGLHRRPPV